MADCGLRLSLAARASSPYCYPSRLPFLPIKPPPFPAFQASSTWSSALSSVFFTTCSKLSCRHQSTAPGQQQVGPGTTATPTTRGLPHTLCARARLGSQCNTATGQRAQVPATTAAPQAGGWNRENGSRKAHQPLDVPLRHLLPAVSAGDAACTDHKPLRCHDSIGGDPPAAETSHYS